MDYKDTVVTFDISLTLMLFLLAHLTNSTFFCKIVGWLQLTVAGVVSTKQTFSFSGAGITNGKIDYCQCYSLTPEIAEESYNKARADFDMGRNKLKQNISHTTEVGFVI